ncbi:MAG: hypothetical protein CL787_01860 [Chloroflexi bacterium]|nr:hypothetical protein [Chloroflexota bacterium]
MQPGKQGKSPLEGPKVNQKFSSALEELVSIAKRGHSSESEFFNPSNDWISSQIRVFQDLPDEQRESLLQDVKELEKQAQQLNAEGKAAPKVWPDSAVRLDSGGVAFFSQLGVARRPDLTQYFIDGFNKNRDALAFDESNQALFAEIIPLITDYLKESLSAGNRVVQTDRQIGDVPGKSFHARQLLFGTQYPQLPYMWRQLTFPLPTSELQSPPDILEVSIPNWLTDLPLPDNIREKVLEAGLERLVFKAPTKGLSLHLGFDYMGEHKMGPLSIAMFKVKEADGLALQAALSMAHVKTINNDLSKTAIITTGPSLHGKSTLTVMLEFAKEGVSKLVGLDLDPSEGVYPMNDDIILLQPRVGDSIPYGIYGTENSFYAVPFGLTKEDDPITYDVLRGTENSPNSQETLENVPINENGTENATPDFMSNPVRNMRMVLSRSGLLKRKGVDTLLGTITKNQTNDAVHIPMEHTDKILWQGVMRQNTVVPPLVRLTAKQYIRSLMFGEAVQTGASTGAIGRPYVEYFSDPFIIGLEDDNANLLHKILTAIEGSGMNQGFYMFNTGGVGADTNEEATGANYKKIARELTLQLQEALLREAVKFEPDPILGIDIAVAIIDSNGKEVIDLRPDWLPQNIYGSDDYNNKIDSLKYKRYYGSSQEDKAGILRYTKANNEIFEIDDIPSPRDEREAAWLISFYWSLDQVYENIPSLDNSMSGPAKPDLSTISAIQEKLNTSLRNGLRIGLEAKETLGKFGLNT